MMQPTTGLDESAHILGWYVHFRRCAMSQDLSQSQKQLTIPVAPWSESIVDFFHETRWVSG